MDEYNENNAVMDLVLFEDAVRHVARITRIISNPRCVTWLEVTASSHLQAVMDVWHLGWLVCGLLFTCVRMR